MVCSPGQGPLATRVGALFVRMEWPLGSLLQRMLPVRVPAFSDEDIRNIRRTSLKMSF
jgi:hypothetical protein